ncbi:uncharacterized protein [Physcomitrium patens]|uniref:Uncharacterized protein n=2 Tax=Physcomitrium patens TaxID=3218 RepID=A0A2K1LBK6_PHYPA|nr:ADP-ribosylation factor 4-like [Physcomitrium patens]PNR63415.1 hypothetical protein PHYPA_001841 [Physcomitrium patens]|eukprot:XP_024368459.1 ADP-ribosylation factor 4-like [Physcomitrella patens]
MRGGRLRERMAGLKTPSKSPGKRKNGFGVYYEQILARLFNRFGRYKNHQKLLMLGIDGAGKTSLLRKVKLLEPRTQPTVGFNLESLQYRQQTLVMWDVGGQEKIRSLWHHYFVKSQALIFVVDSSDPSRIPEARKELQKLLHETELKDAKLLVYANKQDVQNCLSVSDLADMLDLSLVEDREWHVQGCSASTGKGVYEGLDWLVEVLKPS